MNNKEFILLSEKEVKKLNGSKHEESYEAWRNGYNYLVNKIRQSFENDYNDEFMTKMENIAMSDLEEFKFNVEM
jgi:hypothetical protein